MAQQSNSSSSKRNRGGFAALDKDVLCGVFKLLPPRALAICAAVCPLWHQVISSRSDIWEKSCKSQAEKLASRFTMKMNESLDVKAEAIRLEHRVRLLCSSEVYSWQAHAGRINCCRLLMNTLATGSSDNTVKVWSSQDCEVPQLKEEYRVPKKMDVAGIEFDGGKIMAAAGSDVYVWKRGNSNVVRKLGGHNQRLCSMHYIDPEVVVGCGDGTIRFFDLYTGSCSLLLRHHRDSVTSIAMSSTLQILASGSYDCTVQLCDVTSGEKIASYFPTSASGISCIHMMQHGTKLVAGTLAGTLDCWDIRAVTKQPIWTVRRASTSALNCIHYQDYGTSSILTGGNDGGVHAYSSYTGNFLESLQYTSLTGHYKSPVLSVAAGLSRALICRADGRAFYLSLGENELDQLL